MKAPRLLRCKEAAEMMGLRADHVRNLANRGVLPVVRDPGGHRRFSEEDILTFKREHLEPQRS